MASLPKGRTLPLCNLLWQVDAVVIPVLRNILRLVLTNWSLMESVFVRPDSFQEHLQSCFTGDWVLMAQKSAWSPAVGIQIFFSWILAMCKNMTFFVAQMKITKWLQNIQRECQTQQTKGCCRESSVPFSSPHVFQGKQKQRQGNARFGCVLHPAVLYSPIILNSAFVLRFHLQTGFESDLPGCFYGKAAVVSGAVQEWKSA